jgi:hypothetical protein
VDCEEEGKRKGISDGIKLCEQYSSDYFKGMIHNIFDYDKTKVIMLNRGRLINE